MKLWTAIPNYEGLYEINTKGEIRSLHNRYSNETVILKQGVGYFKARGREQRI